MRLYEFDIGATDPNVSSDDSFDIGAIPNYNLLTALELIRNRYKDSDTPPKIKTQALINLILNTDRSFDYNALVDANETPAVQNLIKDMNRQYVTLQPFGDEGDDDVFGGDAAAPEPQDIQVSAPPPSNAAMGGNPPMDGGQPPSSDVANNPEVQADLNEPYNPVADMAQTAAKRQRNPIR
jgi:hypothetical protein